MALLPPANIHEKTFNDSGFVYWYGRSLFGRNSPDVVEDKPCFEACNVIFRNVLTSLL